MGHRSLKCTEIESKKKKKKKKVCKGGIHIGLETEPTSELEQLPVCAHVTSSQQCPNRSKLQLQPLAQPTDSLAPACAIILLLHQLQILVSHHHCYTTDAFLSEQDLPLVVPQSLWQKTCRSPETVSPHCNHMLP